MISLFITSIYTDSFLTKSSFRESSVVKSRQSFHAPRKLSTLCALDDKVDDELRPKFRQSSQVAEPKRSFLPANTPTTTSKTLLSPNERILRQIQESLSNLSPLPDSTTSTATPKLNTSEIKLPSVFVGIALCFGISVASWKILLFFATFFNEHDLDSEIYIVQRLGAVVRTIIVAGFALATGFSAVTGLGLTGIFGRVVVDRIKGVDVEEEKEQEG